MTAREVFARLRADGRERARRSRIAPEKLRAQLDALRNAVEDASASHREREWNARKPDANLAFPVR